MPKHIFSNWLYQNVQMIHFFGCYLSSYLHILIMIKISITHKFVSKRVWIRDVSSEEMEISHQVFSSSKWSSDWPLLLRGLGNGVAPEENNMGTSWRSIIKVTCPISIEKGMHTKWRILKRPWWKCTNQITKRMLDCGPMHDGGGICCDSKSFYVNKVNSRTQR